MALSTQAKPVILSGLIAGMVFLVVEMGMLAATGGNPFGPPRMMAAIAMGKEVLPPPASFDMSIMLVAILVHLAISLVFAAVFSLIYSRIGRHSGTAMLAGTIFGLGMYFFNFYIMTNVWPWFENGRGWLNIFTHIVFGAVLGWAFHQFRPSEAKV